MKLIAPICSALVLLVFIASGGPARAEFPEAYPGSLWGTGYSDFSKLEGWGTMGNLTQGVQWTTLPGDIALTTYGSYSWRFRSLNERFFNAHGPALGTELAWKIFKFGANYEWQKYPELGVSTNDFLVYITWYFRHDFFGPTSWALGFPTTSWGKVFRDFNDLEGTGTMGWATQGIEWFRVVEDVIFKTQASYRWRFRSQNDTYYDAHGPGLSAGLNRKSVDLDLGYTWWRYPNLGQTNHTWLLELTWYLDWDLKGK